MTKNQFKRAFERIEIEVLAGRMSASAGLARCAILGIDFGGSARDQAETAANDLHTAYALDTIPDA